MNFSLESLYTWYRNMIRHPQYRWWIVLGTLIYLVSPLDFLPDIFPVVGWIDDGLLATLLVTEISQLVLARLQLRTDRQKTVRVEEQ
ncbi:MAG: YkvA family protein [Snowella sp.]|jgi:uncharacterized membrane protein YkvA (DUF1232 family)|nr:YkvA family protein [Snowella sp.]